MSLLPSILRRMLPRGRALLWTSLALGLGLVVLVVLAILFRFEIRLDVAAILIGLAVLLLGATLFHLARHWTKPKSSVSIGYHVKLEQPLVPVVGRYSFRLEVFYEVEQKTERARYDQGTIELRFKKNDHPEIFEWCCQRVSEHLRKHEAFAASRFPGAEILPPPEPTPSDLRAELASSQELLPPEPSRP